MRTRGEAQNPLPNQQPNEQLLRSQLPSQRLFFLKLECLSLMGMVFGKLCYGESTMPGCPPTEITFLQFLQTYPHGLERTPGQQLLCKILSPAIFDCQQHQF